VSNVECTVRTLFLQGLVGPCEAFLCEANEPSGQARRAGEAANPKGSCPDRGANPPRLHPCTPTYCKGRGPMLRELFNGSLTRRVPPVE
jgi:hypothetical protein